MASGFLCWICSICNNMFKNSRTLRLGGTAPRQVDSAQTKKRPQFRRTGGAMFRYKDLPECQSICGLCAYCSSCTYTLLRPRRSRLGLRTSGNSLVPAILDSSLSGGQTCDGHAEGAAGNVVQANLVAELNGDRVAAVLAADEIGRASCRERV